jgi:hypothetical protein
MQSVLALSDMSLSDCTEVLSVLLILLFLVRGLYKTYPIFFAYWIFDALMFGLPLLFNDFDASVTAELIAMMFRWVLYFLLVIELVDRILADHPGIALLGRRVVQVVMIVAVAAAIWTLQFDSARISTVGNRLHWVLQAERVVTGCLLVFLLAIMAFLWFFPVRLNRNTKAYCFGFTAFFLAGAVGPFLINTGGTDAIERANLVHVGGVLLCQVMWLFAITRRGAEVSLAFPRRWTALEQQKALATLGAFEKQIFRGRGR